MRFWCLACLSLALLVGCRGCGDPCADVTCSTGSFCSEGACVADPVACDPACTDGAVCVNGTCESLEPQCSAPAEACDASRPTNDGFFCVDYDGPGPRSGECVEPCAEDGSCDPGALCFYLAGFDDPACTSNEECAAGTECAQGACRDTICRPAECDGFITGAARCDELYANVQGFESGAQCYNVGNDARYCYPAGVKAEGEACTSAFDAIVADSYENTCAPGLACVDGACVRACSEDGVCGGDDSCILEDEAVVDTGVGICGQSCTPFESGSCGADATCIPVTGEEGICVPAGSTAAFEACTPGAGECVDGTVCLTYQEGPPAVARCQPICDVSAGPAGEDGSVGDFAQAQRDATCPQPAEPPVAYIEVVNLAQTPAAVDVYFGDEATPRVAALGFGQRSDADPQAASIQWLEIAPATYAVTVLAAGAPRTDVPLAELTLALTTDEARAVFLLPVLGASDEIRALELDAPRDVPPPAVGGSVRVLHGLVDAAAVDVVAVPPGDDLSIQSNQVVLAAGLLPDAASMLAALDGGSWDILAFPAGDPRTDRAAALASGAVTVDAGHVATIALRGTTDPDDLPEAGIAFLELVEPPAVGSRGPTFTCVDLGNTVFGFCQENCGDGTAGFGADVCAGEQMACHPTYLDVNFRYANLCSPLGEKVLGDHCDPLSPYSECGVGLHCLEYGNTSDDFDAENRGRCVSYCNVDDASDPTLSCAEGQGCAAIDGSTPDYLIGVCGFGCDAGPAYSDDGCPAGLASCKPTASLQADPANPDRPPSAQVEPSFCSASGDIPVGQTCFGNDCAPGSECMFPRSEQETFTATLLSPYFGAPGLTPSCHAQCDPFDGDSSTVTCGADETCLFNYPWSAEVGHCAPIAEERTPLDGCEFPGQACGEDSICVINGGTATCFQFCQYDGPDAQGALQQESCGTGLLCAPLVNDIGVCLSP